MIYEYDRISDWSIFIDRDSSTREIIVRFTITEASMRDKGSAIPTMIQLLEKHEEHINSQTIQVSSLLP